MGLKMTIMTRGATFVGLAETGSEKEGTTNPKKRRNRTRHARDLAAVPSPSPTGYLRLSPSCESEARGSSDRRPRGSYSPRETLKPALHFLAFREGRVRHGHAGMREGGSPRGRSRPPVLNCPDGGRRPRRSSAPRPSNHGRRRGRHGPRRTPGARFGHLGGTDAAADTRGTSPRRRPAGAR